MEPVITLHRPAPGLLEVECAGAFDIGTVGVLRDALDLATSVAADQVVLDLRQVDRVDGSTATVVAAAALAAARRGAGFSLVPPAGPARRYLDHCGLTALLAA